MPNPLAEIAHPRAPDAFDVSPIPAVAWQIPDNWETSYALR